MGLFDISNEKLKCPACNRRDALRLYSEYVVNEFTDGDIDAYIEYLKLKKPLNEMPIHLSTAWRNFRYGRTYTDFIDICRFCGFTNNYKVEWPQSSDLPSPDWFFEKELDDPKEYYRMQDYDRKKYHHKNYRHGEVRTIDLRSNNKKKIIDDIYNQAMAELSARDDEKRNKFDAKYGVITKYYGKYPLFISTGNYSTKESQKLLNLLQQFPELWYRFVDENVYKNNDLEEFVPTIIDGHLSPYSSLWFDECKKIDRRYKYYLKKGYSQSDAKELTIKDYKNHRGMNLWDNF